MHKISTGRSFHPKVQHVYVYEQSPVLYIEWSTMSADRFQHARNLLMRAVESLQDTGTGPVSRPNMTAPQSEPQTSSSSQSRTQSMLSERNRLFNFGFKRSGGKNESKSTKKKRLSMWTHDFVCLANTACTKPPTSLHAGELLRAGLGRKQLTMFGFGDSSDFHSEIMNAFPDLKEGGGYELLRVGDSGGQRNTLQLIPSPPEGYTVNYVKEVVHQAKVYIRPVQQNLSLQPKPSQSDILSCLMFVIA